MTNEDVQRFTVVEGDDKPLKYHRRKGKPQQWVCRTCERDRGVATSAIIQVVQAPFIEGNKLKVSMGVKIWVCAHCLAREIITRVT